LFPGSGRRRSCAATGVKILVVFRRVEIEQS
jgi:hypothetical protein